MEGYDVFKTIIYHKLELFFPRNRHTCVQWEDQVLLPFFLRQHHNFGCSYTSSFTHACARGLVQHNFTDEFF